VLVAIPIGYLCGGLAGAATAFATGNLVVTVYEFCHSAQHLNTAPRTRFMKRIKQLHLAHHFHNEQGNYGITSFFWDRLFGTHYGMPKNATKSATVFNLGYTEAMAERYPWVADLSDNTRGDGNPRRFREPTAAGSPE
jgi:sterol desaturase/sphingolipid hydroxylase (fatty acid hydroxylase superfamily)